MHQRLRLTNGDISYPEWDQKECRKVIKLVPSFPIQNFSVPDFSGPTSSGPTLPVHRPDFEFWPQLDKFHHLRKKDNSRLELNGSRNDSLSITSFLNCLVHTNSSSKITVCTCPDAINSFSNNCEKPVVGYQLGEPARWYLSGWNY